MLVGRCCAGLAAAVTAALLLDPSPAVAREYRELVTPEFTLISGAPEKRLRRIAADLELFQFAVGQLTGVREFTPRVPTRIYALEGHDYELLRPRQLVAGFVNRQPLFNDIVLDLRAPSANGYEIVYHEYTHFIMRNEPGAIYPAWYEEGIADLLSTVIARGDTVEVGRPPIGRLSTARDARWIALETLFTVDRRSREYVNHNVAPTFYAQSWLMVHYALFGARPERSRQLEEFLKRTSAGSAVPDAFRDSFGGDYAALEVELRAHASQRTFAFATLEMDRTPAAESAAVRRMSEAESSAELGHLMLRLSRSPASTEDLFRFALRKPGAAQAARAGLAAALDRQGKRSQADELISAILLTPQDAFTYFTLGALLVERSSRDRKDAVAAAASAQRARELFGKSLELDRLDLRSALGYGVTYAFTADDPGTEALPILHSALERVPTSAELAMLIATLYLRQGKPELAGAHLEIVERNARDFGMREEAARLLKELATAAPTRDAGAPQPPSP